ncbi:MAG TPA: Ig-like domain-containing protein, partial [Rhizomicrobium sp.]|nr:Ig-like domain-containing protein [Rhizomicrobium sp.]
ANVGNSVAGTYGHITINSDGSYTYNADNTSAIDSAATGSHLTDTFTYQASDGHGGTTTTNIIITLDRAPTVVNDSGSDVESGTLNVLAASGVLANDSDRDGDTLTVSAVGGSGANVGNSFATTYGHITLNADGSYSYVADNTSAIDAAATGSHPIDTVTLTVSDGHGGTTNETLSITIDRAPTVVSDSDAAVESASASGNVLTNDSDKDGDTLTVSAVNGSGANVGNSIAGTYGHITINSDGSYTYNADNTSAIDSAATGSHLTDSFTYTASDGHGGTTSTTIVITLDRAPTVVNDTGNDNEGGTLNVLAASGVLANDSDRDGDSLVVSAVNGNANGVGHSIATTYGHITINSDGSYSYVADNTSAIDGAATGSHPIDTVTITVDDGHGGTTNETLSLTIDRASVAGADSLNTAENSSATVGSGSPVNANLLANDSDPDGDSFSITQVNGSGANVGTQIVLASGALLTVNANGTYTYDPNHAFDYLADATNSGASDTQATDTFTYTITGGSTVTVTVTINGVDSNDVLIGTAGNDTLNGGIGDDVIYDDNGLNSGHDPHDTSSGFSGGIDSFSGGSGNDTFYMGANLTAADHIDGGTNSDRVILNGDYSGGLTFTSTTMVNVENLGLTSGHSYNLTMDNATVTAGNTLRLQAGTLGAGDNVTFDASNDTTGGNYVMNTGAGNDVLTGGIGNDRFRPGGGNDTINGNGGDDRIAMTSNLTASDSIDGGNGDDIVILKGDYSAGLVFGATTMVNVETLGLVKGFSYNLTLAAATDPLGDTLTVHAQSLQASNAVTLDGSAVAGDLVINTGDGNDVLTGGTGDDTFRPGSGVDTIHGGGGDDTINMMNSLTAADTIDGGTGNNKLLLDGFYSGVNALAFGATTVTNIQLIELGAGHDYSLTLNAATVGAGQSLTIRGDSLLTGDKMTIDASALGATSSVVIDGGGGPNTLIGGAGNDIIRGGTGVDHITGGGGADLIYGGGGNDVFIYNSASNSTSTNYDSIKDFDALSDHFQIVGWAVNAINAEVTTGHLNAATFDTDLATAITGAQLGAHDAVVFDPNHGDLHNHLFLIVDMNGVAGYQAGQDLVIDITGAANIGSLSTGNFMT